MTSIEHENPIEGQGLPVLLTVRGEQYFDGLEPDATELLTDAELRPTPEGLLISYEESSLTGMEGTTTTFEVKGPQVILTRPGSEQPRPHLTERGGLLEIRYSIAVDHTATGRNVFKIRVKRKS